MAVVLYLISMLCAQGGARAQSPPPAAGADGTISGKVLDATTGEPIIEAGVEVIQTGKRVRTDLDGKYSIKVPPGTYELRIFAPLYIGTRLQKLVVRPNAVATANASLAPEGQAAVEVVEVVAQADKAAEAVQLLERKNADVVSDNIGAETIRKSPDSDAAEVVERVPAVTVKDDKFVFVRGLGERYSSALLNGSRLPSTDPNRRVVPLDLFPADFIESLAIIKSYTPNLPGDFAGGLVAIRLKEFPEQLTYSLGVSTGLNSRATFRTFDTYRGSAVDYFGFGGDARALSPVFPERLVPPQPPSAQARFYAAHLPNVWNVEQKSAPPNFGVTFNAGNSWGPFGAAVGGVYSTEYTHHSGEINRVIDQKGASIPGQGESIPFIADDFTGNRSIFETTLGGVLTAGYRLTPSHRFSFRGLVNRHTTDDVATKHGTAEDTGSLVIDSQTFQYTEDQLGFTQLGGEHRWERFSVDWRTAIANTTEDVPDRRQLRYVSFDSATPALDPAGAGGPLRTYLGLDEYLTDSAVDVTVPFKTGLPFTDVWSGLPARFTFGPAYAYRRRLVEYRRFILQASNTQGLDLTQPPEVLLQPANVGTYFALREDTRPDDEFSATQEIAALYGMLELPLLADRLKIVGGVRTEYSYITATSRRQTALNDLDPLPGVNLIYSPRDDMNVRYGYSMSVSRPEFRELTPSFYIVEEGELIVVGNQSLVSASIQSHDLRWEWFFSPLEVTSVGVFYKELTNPIEATIISGGDKPLQTFKNAPEATLYGVELEGRKEFGFLAPTLRATRGLSALAPYAPNLSLSLNVSVVESEVNFGEDRTTSGVADLITSRSRALQGQAPYTINAALEYALEQQRGVARLLYNTSGRTLALAGFSRIPDAFQEARDQLDFVCSRKINPFGTPLTAKLSAENLLNDDVLQTQADFTKLRYRNGVKLTFGISYSF
jgi:hypothetical protein